MTVSPYISVYIVVLAALAVAVIGLLKRGLPANNPWTRKGDVSIFQRFRHNAPLLILIVIALGSIVAFGWFKYFNFIQSNITP